MKTRFVVGEKETESFGMSLAPLLHAGDVLWLRGELGAGKTVFARGVARGLGVRGPVASPTFTLLHVYDQADIPMTHLDLYRLEDADAFYDAGLAEFVGGRYVSLVEWPDRCAEALPEARLEIAIERAGRPETRAVTLTPRGGLRERENICIRC